MSQGRCLHGFSLPSSPLRSPGPGSPSADSRCQRCPRSSDPSSTRRGLIPPTSLFAFPFPPQNLNPPGGGGGIGYPRLCGVGVGSCLLLCMRTVFFMLRPSLISGTSQRNKPTVVLLPPWGLNLYSLLLRITSSSYMATLKGIHW